jgi:two-component sensor histidine kinase
MVAKPDLQENLLRPRDFVDVLGTGWPFRAVTIVPYAAVTLLPTTASELGRLSVQSLPVAFGVALFSVSVVVGLVFLVRLILPAKWRRNSTIIVGALLVTGALRGTIVSTVMVATGLEENSHLTSRIFLGALSLPLVLALISLVVSRVMTARAKSVSTRKEILATERKRDRILGEVDASDERLREEVNETLRPAISALVDDIHSERSARSTLADKIDAFANDVVRPLSHTLASAGSAVAEKRRPAIRAVALPTRPAFREQINATFSGLGVFLGSGTVLLDLLPPASGFVAALISGLSVFGIIRLLSAIVGGRQFPFAVAGIIIAGTHAAAWIPPHLINQRVLFPADLDFQPWLISSIAMPLLGLLYQLIILGEHSNRTSLARLDDARIEILIQLSEARRRAWLRQRHLTHTLHSTVQSRVHAEARLVRSGSGKISSTERDHAINVVTSALNVVTAEPEESADAMMAIRQLVDFWSGMCTISLDVGPGVGESAAADDDFSRALQIVALEMVSNAIRHGHATEIAITIARSSPGIVMVVAANNGTPVSTRYRAGLGIALYDELTVHWSLTNGERVTMTAALAAREMVPTARAI